MTDSKVDIPSVVADVRSYFETHVTKTYDWRIKQLKAVSTLLEENEKELVSALNSDIGKPAFEATFSELVTAQTETKVFIDNLKSWMKPTKHATPLSLLPGTSYVVREPYGVVLIIAPFNYPVQLTILPLIAAIAAGNVAVIKPSELTPVTSALMAKLIPKYLDTKAFKVIEGAIPETTALLKEKWDYIFFTGSEMVGKVVLRAAAEHLTPCTLELGGKSPVIVDETADLTLAARRIMWGKCFNAGQSCIAPDYVFVHKNIKQQFLKAVTKQIETFYTKTPETSTDFGRIINARHTQRLKALIDAHKSDIIAGGKVDVDTKYVAPTVLDVKLTGKVMEEEIFGPILPVVEFTDMKEVINYINSRPKPLALYIFSNSKATQDDLIAKTSSGGVSINDVMMHFANAELPFGGVGASGYGAYHGKHGYETFSHSKPVLSKSLYGDAPARYPPFTDFNAKLFRYVAEIYRVNSESFKNVFKYILLPLVIGVIAKGAGLTIGFKSNL